MDELQRLMELQLLENLYITRNGEYWDVEFTILSSKEGDTFTGHGDEPQGGGGRPPGPPLR